MIHWQHYLLYHEKPIIAMQRLGNNKKRCLCSCKIFHKKPAEIKHELGELPRCSEPLGSDNTVASKESLSQWAFPMFPGSPVLERLGPRCTSAPGERVLTTAQEGDGSICIHHGPWSHTDGLGDRCNFSWHHLGITHWWQSYVHTDPFPWGLCASMSPHLDAGPEGVLRLRAPKPAARSCGPGAHGSAQWWKDWGTATANTGFSL